MHRLPNHPENLYGYAPNKHSLRTWYAKSNVSEAMCFLLELFLYQRTAFSRIQSLFALISALNCKIKSNIWKVRSVLSCEWTSGNSFKRISFVFLFHTNVLAICTFGAVINASDVERTLKCAENCYSSLQGWPTLSEAAKLSSTPACQQCGYTWQDCCWKRPICSSSHTPNSSLCHTWCRWADQSTLMKKRKAERKWDG